MEMDTASKRPFALPFTVERLDHLDPVRAVAPGLDPEIGCNEAGERISGPRGIVYAREVSETVLPSESSARQLGDVPGAPFAGPSPRRPGA